MENIANIKTFNTQVVSFLKLCVFANKGTENENALNKCIRLCNKYINITNSLEMNSNDETYVRKALKRLNLILKVDEKGNPIDIKTKENQIRLHEFEPQLSLINNDINTMLSYIKINPIDIFTGLSLSFVLCKGKHQELLWQYVRSLFYISQMIFCVYGTMSNQKKKILDESTQKIEEVLTIISQLETIQQTGQLMALDTFLTNKLVKSGITQGTLNNAKDEVKEMFAKKGLSGNSSMDKMIESISEKLSDVDFSNGNMMQNIFGIAQNVAEELRGDMEQDPQGFQNALGAITSVFQDAMDNNGGEQLPPELRGLMSNLMNMNGSQEGPQIDSALEMIALQNGIDKDTLLKEVTNESGEIDPTKLEKYMSNIKK